MNKFNKGKLIGVVAASLSAVSLMGVGFASWIITGNDPVDVGNITVEVGDVIDNRITITEAKVVQGASGIKFDAVTPTSAVTKPLLTASNGSTQNLSFKLSYKVTNGTDTNGFKIKTYIKAAEGKNLPDFSTAVAKKYIEMPANLGLTSENAATALTKEKGAPKTATGTGVDPAVTGTAGVYTVEQTFTFSWGEAFAKANPTYLTENSDIYNAGVNTSNKKQKADATTVINFLADLKKLVNSTDGFVVVLVPEVTTAA